MVLAAPLAAALSVAGAGAREPTAQRPVETPLCDDYQTKPCEFSFGPDRRFRVPADLLHPSGFN